MDRILFAVFTHETKFRESRPFSPALADEGGVSYWLPGSHGSLAAVPAVPGWSIAAFDYYDSVSAGRSVDVYRAAASRRASPAASPNCHVHRRDPRRPLNVDPRVRLLTTNVRVGGRNRSS